MVEKYYEILGVTGKAGLSEIKKAFRSKAKELHPDVNKDSNAHQQFISLVEAYEYLVNLKTGKIYVDDAEKNKKYTYRRWQDDVAARARHRAEYYSRVKYQDFTRSQYYKTVTSWDTIFGHFSILLALGAVIILPVVLTLIYGTNGFIMSLIIALITLPNTVDAIRSRPEINIKTFLKAFLYVAQTGTALTVTLSVLNFYLFLKVGLQTLIPLHVLLLSFALASAITFFLLTFLFKKVTKPALIISLCYCPLALNLLLAINFLFSSNPVFETYSFTHKRETSLGSNSLQKVTYIDLENNKYADFSGIRLFEDYDSMKDANKITYRFEDGLFGFRVMKDFKFGTVRKYKY